MALLLLVPALWTCAEAPPTAARPVPSLRFATQPASTLAGDTLAPGLVVEAVDEHGVIDPAFAEAVTVTADPETIRLLGTTTVRAEAGVARFADLVLDSIATGIVLEATAPGARPATSARFNVAPRPPALLEVVSGSGQTATTSSALPQPYVVRVTDSRGVTVRGTVVRGAVIEPDHGSILSAALTDSVGVARFTRRLGTAIGVQRAVLSLEAVPALRIEVADTAMARPTGLRVVQQPDTFTAGTAVLVVVEAIDTNGQLARGFSDTVDFALIETQGGVIAQRSRVAAIRGVARFDSITINRSGTYQLLLDAYGPGGIYGHGRQMIVLPAPGSRLIVASQPHDDVVGFPITMTVVATDEYGNYAPAFDDTIRITATGASALRGTTARQAERGVAHFSVTLDQPAEAGRLMARAAGAAPATSTPFAVTARDGRYHSIVLGTLGGNSTRPYAVDDSARVVGQSLDAAGIQQAFLWDGELHALNAGSARSARATAIDADGVVWGAALIGNEHRFLRWRGVVVEDLGLADYDYDYRAASVGTANRQGAAIGHVGGDHGSSSYLLRAGELVRIPGFSAASHRVGATINDAGVVAGSATAYFRGPSDNYYSLPFLWYGDSLVPLPVLEGGSCAGENPAEERCPNGFATSINNAGLIVGASDDSTGGTQAVLWQDGGIRVLTNIPCMSALAVKVNDRGQIAIAAANRCGGGSFSEARGYRWENGVLTDIGSLGGAQTSVTAMNENGAIVGSSLTASGERHAFVWLDGRMIDLGASAPGRYSVATGINADGDVIGFSTDDAIGTFPTGSARALLWRVAR